MHIKKLGYSDTVRSVKQMCLNHLRKMYTIGDDGYVICSIFEQQQP